MERKKSELRNLVRVVDVVGGDRRSREWEEVAGLVEGEEGIALEKVDALGKGREHHSLVRTDFEERLVELEEQRLEVAVVAVDDSRDLRWVDGDNVRLN